MEEQDSAPSGILHSVVQIGANPVHVNGVADFR